MQHIEVTELNLDNTFEVLIDRVDNLPNDEQSAVSVILYIVWPIRNVILVVVKSIVR